MAGAFLLITALVAALHVTSCAKDMKQMKMWTKPLLVPLLGLSWLFSLDRVGIVFSLWPAVLAGLAFYTLGDVLLMIDRKWALPSGMVSFSIGHICFTWIFTRYGMSGLSLMIWSVIWVALWFFLVSTQIEWNGKDARAKAAYSFMVMLFGIAVGGSTFGGDVWAKVTGIAGVIIFGLSDSMILYEMKKKTDMSAAVMTTYISAVALLLLSTGMLAL